MAHEWSPADLPSDFKLFEWDFARNDLISLDANGGIASIADTWAGRLAVTTSTANRRTLASVNGVQGAYKPGTSSNTLANGLSLTDTSLLPIGNADRYLGFALINADGVIGGYGDSGKDYWLDSPFNPGYRVHLNGTTTTAQLSTDKTTAHFTTLQSTNGVTTLRVDGVSGGSFGTSLNTTATKFGIAGYDQSYYTMNGYTFYVVVGKRAPTSDEQFLYEAWIAKYKTKRTPPSDNPYRPAAAGGSDLPMVADSGGGTVTSGTGSMVATGALAATGSAIVSGTATMGGAGALSAVGGAIKAGMAALAGAGNLVANGASVASRTVMMIGSSALSAIGGRIAAGRGALTGSGSLKAQPPVAPTPPADPADTATIDMSLVPVDAKRTDWPRLVANAVNALIKQYRVMVKSPFMLLDTAPFDPTEGQTYYDTTLHQVRVWNGSTWVAL